MGRIHIFKRNLSGEEIMNIETVLGSIMQPVTPRQEFVKSLRERVLMYSFPEAEEIDKQVNKNILVLLLSLMGATLVLGVWIRVVLSLSKMIGINQSPSRARKRRIAPIHTAA